MRLNITHRTVYRYEGAPIYSAQILRLTPRTNLSQHVLRWKIDAPGGLSAWNDAFGNTCHTHVVEDPPEQLAITAYGEVVTTEVSGVLPAEVGDLPTQVFLRQTARTRPSAEMTEFAGGFAARVEADRLDGLHELMAALHEKIDFDTERTTVDSTAAEAFEAGCGVCQDQAHVFAGVARALGVPARYVSGYLYDPELGNVSAAGHAWAAAWVRNLGWVSFDPVHCRSATDAYVSLAVGLDYDSASPVRGMRTGGHGDEGLEVSVSVNAQQ